MGLFKVKPETKETIKKVLFTTAMFGSYAGVVAGIGSVVAMSSMVVRGACGFYGTKLKDTVGTLVTFGSMCACSDAILNIPGVDEYFENKSEDFADTVTDLIFDEE